MTKTSTKANKTDTIKKERAEAKKEQERTTRAKASFLVVFKKTACNISMSCNHVGINRATYYDWIANDDVFKEKVEDEQEALIDYSESQLMSKIEAKDTICILFHLKTKGKTRGYVEKTELEHSGKLSMAEFFGKAPDENRTDKSAK